MIDAVLADGERGAADVGHAVADADVLDAAGEPDRLALGARGVVERLDLVERRFEPDSAQRLARAEAAALDERVAPAHLPGVDAELVREHVDAALDGEARLIGAEPAHGSAGRIVGVDGDAFDVDVGHVVGAGGVAARALDDLAADRGVGTLVADEPHPDCGELAVGVAPDGVGHLDRMALGVQPDRLHPIDRQLHRPAGHRGQKRRLRLDREVLLAAERASAAHQRHRQLVRRQRQRAGDLPMVVVNALALGVDVQLLCRCTIYVDAPAGHRQARLRLEEGVLDELRRPGPGDHVRRARQRRVGIAARRLRRRQHVVGVAVLRMQQRRTGGERLRGRGQRLEHLVVDGDELGGAARDQAAVGRDGDDDVAGVARLLADGDEERPVGIDEPLPALSRHVGGTDDRVYARQRPRGRHVDGANARPRMRREHHGAVQHPGHGEVVDVLAIAERQLLRLVLGQRCADLPRPITVGQCGGARQHLRGQLDRVDDLDVAGAATQVRPEALRDLGACRQRRLLENMMRAHNNAGDAEAALHGRRDGECAREYAARAFVDAFERDDAASRRLVGGHRTRHLRLAIDEHGTAAALARRRAAVLGRRDGTTLADDLEERRALVGVDGTRLAVQRQLDARHPR